MSYMPEMAVGSCARYDMDHVGDLHRSGRSFHWYSNSDGEQILI
jgi:hypothetical protein